LLTASTYISGDVLRWTQYRTAVRSLENAVLCCALFTKPYHSNDRAVLVHVCVAMGMLLHSNEHLQISTVADRLSMFATCGRIPRKAPTPVFHCLSRHIVAYVGHDCLSASYLIHGYHHFRIPPCIKYADVQFSVSKLRNRTMGLRRNNSLVRTVNGSYRYVSFTLNGSRHSSKVKAILTIAVLHAWSWCGLRSAAVVLARSATLPPQTDWKADELSNAK
jgi:hypothetical protein